MPPSEPAAVDHARRPLDERALERVLRRLQASPQAPWLHGEVARRMAERLAIVRQQPEVVLDWWAHTGAGGELLRRAYPRARVQAVERQPAPLGPTRWWLRRWQRALAVDGFLMFSTLGPGTFESLRAIYRRQGWPTPFAPFVDMHDLGDMLVESGFADPVMDQQTLTLTWPDTKALLAELRALGGNVDPGRHPGLRTPRWRDRLAAALDAAAAGGRPGLSFELVFGHAFRAPPRPRLAATTSVPLDDLRAMVRSGRNPA
jgi:malonyl-CoA O-methyltransferase